MSDLEANKALIRSYFQRCWNEGDLDYADEIMAEDYDLHLPGGMPGGRAMWKMGTAMLRSVFSDLVFENLAMIAEGEFVAVRSVMHATHSGEFMGIAPTGRRFSNACADYYQLRGGKMIGHWDVPDLLSLLKQIGALPDHLVANLPFPGFRDAWPA